MTGKIFDFRSSKWAADKPLLDLSPEELAIRETRKREIIFKLREIIGKEAAAGE